MGLDMYLKGDNYTGMYLPDYSGEKPRGSVTSEKIHLGYWRKHPNLHGYIVETFANGEDECQEISLSEDDLKQIIEAVKVNKLPHTEGFFFGDSKHHDNDEAMKETIESFQFAIDWLNDPNRKKEEWRSVEYRASW